MNQYSMKKFILLVIGQFISSFGSGLTDFGLAIYVLHETGSVMATGIISVCAFLPSILLSPIGGVLADHYDRRLLMIAGEALSAVGLVICLVSIMSGHFSMVIICIGVAVSSVFTALMEPAFKATVTDMISPEDYAKAGGLLQIAGNAKLLIAPAVAGLLLEVTSVATLLIIDIFTFITTACVILVVKKNMAVKVENKGSLRVVEELKGGMEAIAGNKGIIYLIGLMTLATFCIGVIQILCTPLILAFTGEKELGFIKTISTCGILVGSIIVGCFKNVRYHKMMVWGLIGCGFFMGIFGIKENFVLLCIFGFLMFCFIPAASIGPESLMRKALPNEVHGRAFGFTGLITQMGYITAYLLSGVLSDYVFEPFMQGNSSLAVAIGTVIGRGEGRGIALLIFAVGLLMMIIAIWANYEKSIREME
jgi:MFS family permease